MADKERVYGKNRARQGRRPASAGLLCKAQVAFRAGHIEEAQRLAFELLAEDDSHVGALELLAKAQWQGGAYEELLQTLSRLIRLNPYEPGYHALKGAALQCLGRYDAAIRSFVRGGDTAGSQEAVFELRKWQAKLVKDLLRDDPVFRAHYARNPEKACAEKGFAFGNESKVREWILSTDAVRAALFTRPS